MMRRAERIAAALALVASLGIGCDGRGATYAGTTPLRPNAAPGVRLSMAALHEQGGVPLGWQFSLPPGDAAAGRRAFDAFGCPGCHRVAGETFAHGVPEPRGPELTGMGSHHPPAYFAEAIVHPNAVLIDAPGYIGDDGRSNMPSYDDMTIGELRDIVAYLAALRDDAPPSCHVAGGVPASGLTTIELADRPPPAPAAQAFFSQRYDVLPGQLDALQAWFATRGRDAFLASDGVVGLDTFVDLSRPAPSLTTVFAFRDEAALRTFAGDPAMADVWKEFDAFVGPHGHVMSRQPLVYRVPALSR
jgi:hypothetical protein